MRGYAIVDDRVIYKSNNAKIDTVIGFELFRLYKEEYIHRGDSIINFHNNKSRYAYELSLHGKFDILKHLYNNTIKIIMIAEDDDDFTSFEFEGSAYSETDDSISLFGFAEELKSIPDNLNDENITFKYDKELIDSIKTSL